VSAPFEHPFDVVSRLLAGNRTFQGALPQARGGPEFDPQVEMGDGIGRVTVTGCT